MTREAFAEMICWPWIIWIIGIINPLFMIPQLWKICATRKADDISLWMLSILFLIQTGFALHGYFLHDTTLVASNSAAAAVTLLTAVVSARLK